VRSGGNGVISVTANVAPNKMHRYYKIMTTRICLCMLICRFVVNRMLAASKAGKREEAESLNNMLIPLHKGYQQFVYDK
jgi:dihydrodipicolinate synthase/N-acetylneuraminate lyase